MARYFHVSRRVQGFWPISILRFLIIVELRTPATPVGVGGGKERGGCHLNLRTWHAEGRRPILGLCWPSLGLCWPILRLCWPMPMRTKCCNLQHFALWDGKNPCKYHSFSPRKWLKHSYLQSFRSHHDLRFFEKRVNTSVFCIHQGKKSVQTSEGRAFVSALVWSRRSRI